MNWPVQIIPPVDKIPGIKWSKWFFSFIGILLIVVVSWVGAKIILPAEDDELLKLLTLLFFFGALGFFCHNFR
ncbi:hypothetical protein ACRRAT_22225 [Enterobacter hormaechei]|nr:hypothetical protein [Enterobacter hormaechei]MCO0820252.1 hypothetical protein [Enterobacter hormaechei]MDY7176726.1 hypothetical protein [Enterobacter hormaechei]